MKFIWCIPAGISIGYLLGHLFGRFKKGSK